MIDRLEELGFPSTKESLLNGENSKIIVRDVIRWYTEGLFNTSILIEVLTIIYTWEITHAR